MFWIVFSITAIFLYDKSYKNNKEIKKLRNEIDRLRIELLTDQPDTSEEEVKSEVGMIHEPIVISNKPEAPKEQSKFDKNISAFKVKLAENWIGIIGSIAIVVGVVFLGVYGALLVAPMYKFFIISSFSIVLLGVSFKLRSIDKWGGIGNWVGSAGVTIFLFACLGSVSLTGMQWVSNPVACVLMLLLGIGGNIFFGYKTGDERFSSIHVCLSLLVLFMVPATIITLLLATAIVSLGLLFSYKHRWDIQYIFIILSYGVYHFKWFDEIHGNIIDSEAKLIGIGCVLLIGGIGSFIHYQKDYESRVFVLTPFIAHVLNWSILGINLFFYRTYSMMTPIFLILGGFIAIGISRHAKKLKIDWLFVTDLVLGQLLLMIGIMSLKRFGLSFSYLFLVMVLQSFVFLYYVLRDDFHLLKQIGKYLTYVSITGFLIFCISRPNTALELFDKSILIACLAGVICIITYFKFPVLTKIFPKLDHIYLNLELKSGISVYAFFITVASIVLIFKVRSHALIENYWVLAALILFTALRILKEKYKSVDLYYSTNIILIFTQVIFTISIYILMNKGGAVSFLLFLQMLTFPIFYLIALFSSENYKFEKKVEWPIVYLASIHLGVCTFFISFPISNILPGVLYLIYGLCLFELGRYFLLKKESNDNIGRYIVHMGICFLATFGIRHVLVHMQVEEYIGFIKLRLLIELFAIGCLVYIGTLKWERHFKSFKTLQLFFPLISELIVAVIVFTVALELEQIYHPIYWTLLTIGTYYLGISAKGHARFKFYSILFSWWTIIHISAVTSTIHTPSNSIFMQGWFIGVILLVIQGLFLIYITKDNTLKDVQFPKSLKIIDKGVRSVEKNLNLFGMTPLFIGVAVFLYWRFDKSYLTLLWILEIFTMFIFGIYRKEKIFTTVSLVFLGACLVRLIFFDLANTGTLTRGVVFLGVGAVMVLMSIIQKKFKNRFIE